MLDLINRVEQETGEKFTIERDELDYIIYNLWKNSGQDRARRRLEELKRQIITDRRLSYYQRLRLEMDVEANRI